ncbi:MAG: UvrD-helicase domain-containing protein [Chthoniobacteraceae bacterium]
MAAFRLFDLNPEQERAVRTTEGSLLILAGAGSGKTRVITARAAFLISRGVAPESILAVTFTNKAAKEMRERLATMIDPDQAKKTVMSTFHALCVRILRQDIEKLGYKKNFSIYDEGDTTGLIKKIITRTAARDEKLDPGLAKHLISKAKNKGWREPGDDKALIGAVFARYNQELKNLNAVDFDDLLLLTVKLLDQHGDVRERWQRKFHYIMVDEFQDTNRLQLDLITMLADERKNVAVVGDDDQSIYGWRGAEAANILEFETHFPNPAIIKLEQNYRSTNFILGTANSLIKNNARRRAKKLWSAKEGGEKVRILAMPDDRQEATLIVSEIHSRKITEGLKWEDFAVLFRMNAQSRLFETTFRDLKIPYRVVGGNSFFDSREIKDVLAYAACLMNADDDVSLLRIVNTPARGISDGTVEKATTASIHKRCSVFAIMRDEEFLSELPSRARGAVEKFTAFLDDVDLKMHEPLANQPGVLRAMLADNGYLTELQRTCKTPDEWLKREQNVAYLLNDFQAFHERGDKGLRDWLDAMLLRHEREEEKEEENSGVTLITLHASKGLEFPHVHLVGCEEGVLPHERSKLEGTVDEERRLLYVGITRAKQTLAITWCRNRTKYGSAVSCAPSSFLKELDPDLVERLDGGELLNKPVTQEKATAKFDAILEMLGKL